MTSDSENEKGLRCRKTALTMEEVSCGETDENSPEESHLKKGPWTSAEDAILVQYVSRHGEGNWNTVQKHSGLSRCGKSCRLRWANHLRPDLKKGAITPEEEDCIVELHAKMGNKWSRMAAELPGRTDNEIKNYWNTRIKRLQRAGLPIYPSEIHIQALNESEESDDMISRNNQYSDTSENAFDIPDVEFRNLGLNQGFLNCSPGMLDIPNLVSSQSFGCVFPAMNPHKRLREMETHFRGSSARTSDSFQSFDQYNYDVFPHISAVKSLWSSLSFDPDLNINQTSPIDILGSHTLINGNSSSSSSAPNSEAMKLELPSLQYSASQVSGWAIPLSPLPFLDSADTLIQSLESEHTQSNYPSPRCSGLLEAVVYESRSMKNSLLAGDEVESDASGDPVSPLSHSAASVFVNHTLGSGGNFSGCNMKPEPVEWSPESDGTKDISCPLQYLRPDALLDSFWFGNQIARNKE